MAWTKLTDDIKYNKDLSYFEKVLFSEIRDLTKQDGICRAHNEYFAERHNRKTRTITRAITKLVALGFIITEMNYVSNTRQIKLCNLTTDNETGSSQNNQDNKTKMSQRIDNNVITYRQKCQGLYKEKNNITKQKERKGAAPPLSLSQRKFKETFPKKRIDCSFDDVVYDIDKLISKMQESTWLKDTTNFPLSWHLARYDAILNDEHKDHEKTKSRVENNFTRHDYKPGELDNLYTDLDKVCI